MRVRFDNLHVFLDAIDDAIKDDDALRIPARTCTGKLRRCVAQVETLAKEYDRAMQESERTIRPLAAAQAREKLRIGPMRGADPRGVEDATTRELMQTAERNVREALESEYRDEANKRATAVVEACKAYEAEVRKARILAEGVSEAPGDVQQLLAFEHRLRELRAWSWERVFEHTKQLFETLEADDPKLVEWEKLVAARIVDRQEEDPKRTVSRGWAEKRRAGELDKDEARIRQLQTMLDAAAQRRFPAWLREHEESILPQIRAAFRIVVGVDPRQLTQGQFAARYLGGSNVARDAWDVLEKWPARFCAPEARAFIESERPFGVLSNGRDGLAAVRAVATTRTPAPTVQVPQTQRGDQRPPPEVEGRYKVNPDPSLPSGWQFKNASHVGVPQEPGPRDGSRMLPKQPRRGR